MVAAAMPAHLPRSPREAKVWEARDEATHAGQVTCAHMSILRGVGRRWAWQARARLVLLELGWTGLDWAVLDCSGLGWAGLGWAGLVWP